ncbi:MAG: hypothetical protein JHD16_00370 [Solirubrobacteraceae bacterium]|nr:hypothetical protein [Solirubrobacteraceae bacterium]
MTLDLTMLSDESLTRREQLLANIATQLQVDTAATSRAQADLTLERARRALLADHPNVGYLEFTYGGVALEEHEPRLIFSQAYTYAGSPIGEVTADDLQFGDLELAEVEEAITSLGPIDPSTQRALAVA